MNAQRKSATLAARIYASFPVAQAAFARLLRLLDIEASEAVSSAAVTLGAQSRLLINPAFVAANCISDVDLVMLVLHELHHVALGHTRLFPRVTPAQNWAFDCVINAQLCRLYPQPHHTALFRRCYRSDAMPEAMLRPPEGWRTDREQWLPGRPGEVHRALYGESSVTYADLYRLLPTLVTGGGHGDDTLGGVNVLLPNRVREGTGHPVAGSLSLDRLLGDHKGDGVRTESAPDVLREMRDILAEWPLVERISGRDQGGELQSSSVSVIQAQQAAAATLRTAIRSIADLGSGFGGPIERCEEEKDGVLPYSLRPRRADCVREALGFQTLLHAERLMGQGVVRREAVHVYLDVSGSMEPALPALYATLVSLSRLLHPWVHLFSTQIDDIDLRQLRQGFRLSTGGTDIAPVTRHALEHRVRRALLVTDGWVGDVPDEHARELAARGSRFAAVVTQDGSSDFAKGLGAPTWRLPNLQVPALGRTGR